MELKTFMTDASPDVVQVQLLNEKSGEVFTKKISFQDYLEILTKSKCVKESYVQIGELPRGFVDATVAKKGYFKVVVELPSIKRAAIHNSEGKQESYVIPYPMTLMAFSIKNKNMVESKIYAIKNEDALLYQFPFPNCYSDGGICWGNIKLPPITYLKDTNILVESFFGGIYNHDIFSSNHFLVQAVETASPKSWFQFLNGKEKFPNEYLKPVGDKKKFIRRYLNIL